MPVALGILQRIGFNDIVCAGDGVKAISEINARGGGEAFDIVLTDLHMPRKASLTALPEIQNPSSRSVQKRCSGRLEIPMPIPWGLKLALQSGS